MYCFKNFQVIGGKLLWLIKMRLTRWRQRGLFNGDAVKWSCDWQTKVRLCLPCRLISSSLSKFKRPLPELKKKKKLVREKITRGDGVGGGRGLERLYFSSFPKPQPRNQDSGFSNFGDLPGRLRENQGHYKNTLDSGSNFKFKMPTVIYLLSKKKTGTFPLTWEICQFFWQTKVDTDNDLVREVNTLILRNPWTSEIFQEHSFCSLCYDQSRQISGQATKTQVKRERS